MDSCEKVAQDAQSMKEKVAERRYPRKFLPPKCSQRAHPHHCRVLLLDRKSYSDPFGSWRFLPELFGASSQFKILSAQ
jgi:hypothetical protein